MSLGGGRAMGAVSMWGGALDEDAASGVLPQYHVAT